ncbi:pogo transposable element with KRAB domain [Nephila pilipes]|uniref:Pogo transposable element with KRAB domain n=1 Tax=Nephila pilipes TaxID=299642 RepID=A0A8X6UQ24_NEPPI|nr:pogo transposable element with KRAB domain [Nephila pilipes]
MCLGVSSGWCRKNAFKLRLDSFRCNRMPSNQKELRQIKLDLVIIPGDMTHLLQPSDISDNKPMKEAIRRKWNAWLSDGNRT